MFAGFVALDGYQSIKIFLSMCGKGGCLLGRSRKNCKCRQGWPVDTKVPFEKNISIGGYGGVGKWYREKKYKSLGFFSCGGGYQRFDPKNLCFGGFGGFGGLGWVPKYGKSQN